MAEHENGPGSIAKKIEGALDFYSNPKTWEQTIDECGNVGQSPASRDKGQRAKDALKDWKGG